MEHKLYLTKYFEIILLIIFSTILSRNGFYSSGIVVCVGLLCLMPYVVRRWSQLPKGMSHFVLIFVTSIFMSSIINHSSLLYAFKFISYIFVFLFGYVICKNRDTFTCKRWMLYIIVLLPAILYVFYYKMSSGGLFGLENTYVYYGLSASILYVLVNYKMKKTNRWAWLILGIYVFTAVKLGIIVAIFITLALYSVNSIKHLIYFAILLVTGIIVVFNVDIPLFMRIRNVYDLANNIPLNVYQNIENSSVYEIGETYGNKEDGENDTSFVFRLIHWTRLLIFWSHSDIIKIVFGYGDMYVKNTFDLQPHNEFIKILIENGLLVFINFIVFVISLFRRLKKTKWRYLLFVPIIFMLTENLLYFSVMNFFVFLTWGYFYRYSEIENNKYSNYLYRRVKKSI